MRPKAPRLLPNRAQPRHSRSMLQPDSLADSTQPRRRKVFIKSYGCQMNVYDAQRMTDLLSRDDFEETASAEQADLVILNTCHIRERATEKIFSELGRVRRLKAERRAAGLETTVVVAGCVAQAEGGEILAPREGRGRRGRSAILPSPARARGRRSHQTPDRHGFRSRREVRPPSPADAAAHRARGHPRFSPCRKVATSSAPFASCPTRVAPNCRVPWRRSSPKRAPSSTRACAKSRCSGRTSTATTAKARPAARPASPTCVGGWPKFPLWTVCATRPAIPTTLATTSSRLIATCRS